MCKLCKKEMGYGKCDKTFPSVAGVSFYQLRRERDLAVKEVTLSVFYCCGIYRRSTTFLFHFLSELPFMWDDLQIFLSQCISGAHACTVKKYDSVDEDEGSVDEGKQLEELSYILSDENSDIMSVSPWPCFWCFSLQLDWTSFLFKGDISVKLEEAKSE